MIGPAEIDDLMAEYAETLKKEGRNTPEALTWPPTCAGTPAQRSAPASSGVRNWSQALLLFRTFIGSMLGRQP